MGVPVVSPSNTPESRRIWSGSLRAVAPKPWPGLRRSSSAWMTASVRGMPAGQPSTTPPRPGPWDSPKVVRRKMVPKVLPLMLFRLWGLGVGPTG